MKRTINDFILHFVQFTENLVQDFLQRYEQKKVHSLSLLYMRHSSLQKTNKHSLYNQSNQLALEVAHGKTIITVNMNQNILCCGRFPYVLTCRLSNAFYLTCFILSRSDESVSLTLPAVRNLSGKRTAHFQEIICFTDCGCSS